MAALSIEVVLAAEADALYGAIRRTAERVIHPPRGQDAQEVRILWNADRPDGARCSGQSSTLLNAELGTRHCPDKRNARILNYRGGIQRCNKVSLGKFRWTGPLMPSGLRASPTRWRP